MKRILIPILVGLATLTTACTGTAGTPTPTSATGGSTPTSESSASSDLKSIKACDLISDSEAVDFGFKLPGESKKRTGVESCDWTIPGNGGMQTGVRPDKGLKDLNLQGEKVSETAVGKFKATKVEAQDGSKDTCILAIGASETSSVTVIWTVKIGSGDTATACKQASKAADLIAQKLP
jgi:hypothetical protein